MEKFIDDQEFDQTLKKAKKKIGKSLDTLTVEFEQAREWEGQSYDRLTFNWDKLTGEDFMLIEQSLNLRHKLVISAEFSTDFIMEMAVRCCEEKVDAKFLRKLPIGIFNQIRNGARDFLNMAQV